jgi:SAM-dependent methyltransferase
LYDGTDAEAERRLSEVRRLLDHAPFSIGELTSESDARAGYAAWSPRYDEPGNPIIALEEPVVWSRLQDAPGGRALDAACGTGRHAVHLVQLGYEVVGVDLTPEMLTRASQKLPGATFAQADLVNIPAPDATFDVVVCGLALAHVADLAAAVAELSRVLRPGGRLVVSALHPFQAYLGWHAPFEEGGRRRFVREHSHNHGDYFAAFSSSGLSVRSCDEPVLTATEVRAKRRAFRHIPEATAAAYLGMPGVVVWGVEKPVPQR